MPVLEIYGDIGENWWNLDASITGKSISAWLKENAEGAPEITVRINSYGGAVSEGVAIYNLLSQHAARVTCIVDGFALSAASVIAMAGDEIHMLPGTMMMIHPASGGAWGTAEDMEIVAKALRSMSDASGQIYADRTGKSKEDCLALMDAETWFQPSEALAAGFCDKVVSGKRKAEAAMTARPAQQWLQSYKCAPTAFTQLLQQREDRAREAHARNAVPSARPSMIRAACTPFGELARGAQRSRIGDL
jgi:ATP-dependent Clp endopeptidase proteolytic subunit ClpP